jgi:hypothetical protein
MSDKLRWLKEKGWIVYRVANNGTWVGLPQKPGRAVKDEMVRANTALWKQVKKELMLGEVFRISNKPGEWEKDDVILYLMAHGWMPAEWDDDDGENYVHPTSKIEYNWLIAARLQKAKDGYELTA